MEDALYFGGEAKGLYLLQETDGEERQEKSYPLERWLRFCDHEQISLQ